MGELLIGAQRFDAYGPGAAPRSECGVGRTGDTEPMELSDGPADSRFALLPGERRHCAVDEVLGAEFLEYAGRGAVRVPFDGSAWGVRCGRVDSGPTQCLAVDPVGVQRVVVEDHREDRKSVV